MAIKQVTVEKIGQNDFDFYDNPASKTFSRTTSIGGSQTINKFGYVVDVLWAYGNGTAYTDAAISSALTAVGSSNKCIFLLYPGTWTISNNITITSNIELLVPAGATISVDSGKTFTIGGSLNAGIYPIFSGAGTVAFSSGINLATYPEWWDKTTVAESIQAAVDVLYACGGGDIKLTRFDYDLGLVGVNVKDKVSITASEGIDFQRTSTAAGAARTVVTYTGTGYAFNIGDGSYDCRGAVISGFEIFGDSTGAGGIRISSDAGSSCSGNLIKDMAINGIAGTGIDLVNYCWSNKIENPHIKHCTTAIDLQEAANDTTIYAPSIHTCTTGIRLGKGSGTEQYGIRVIAPVIEQCTTGILSNAPTKIWTMTAPYFEDCTSSLTIAGGGVINCFGGNFDIPSAAPYGILISGGAVVNLLGIVFSSASSSNNCISITGAPEVDGVISAANLSGRNLVSIADDTNLRNLRIRDEYANEVTDYTTRHNTYFAGAYDESWRGFYIKGDDHPRVAMGSNMIMMGDGTIAPNAQVWASSHLFTLQGDTSAKIGSGTWDTGHIQLGDYHIWVESGKLMIKNGAPTGAGQGTVIGTQT